MLNFIFNNLNAIFLALRLILLTIVAIRFFRPLWVRNISYFKLILIVALFNIFCGAFITWGQYHVWATSSDFTRVLVNTPLPKEVPFPALLEWTRGLFSNHLGYFMFYVWGRVWLNILISFLISAVLYLIFTVWKFYRGNFIEDGPKLLLTLMLIAGYPAVLVSIPLGFILSILWSFYLSLRGNFVLEIEQMFIIATFFALLFSNVILSHF